MNTVTAQPARQGSELAELLWGFRRELLVIALFSLVANVMMLAPTLYMLQIYDRVLQSRSELTLLMVSLLTLFLFVVMGFAEWVRSRLLVRAGVRLDKALSTRVFTASFEANLNPAGAPAQRAFSDLTEIRQFITGSAVFALFDAPWTPIYIAVLFYLHPLLGLLAIGFAVVQAGLAWWSHRLSKAPSDAQSQAQSDANNFLQTKLRNAEAVQAMGMLAGLQRRWLERHQGAMARHQNAQSLTHRVTALSKTVRYTQQALVLGAAALLVLDGQLSPGSMIAANVLMNRALAPIDLLAGIGRGFTGARSAFSRLSQLLQAHPQRDSTERHALPEGRIALSQVQANAPGRATPILQDINLVASPGTLTVVLGPSGAGKSTLARVLLGIWPDVTGEVVLDGQALAGWSRAELGPHLGYLPQDIELFDGSIAENIARLAEVDSAKVIAAAESAGLHQIILRLPKGYDTQIGEAGRLLSGGQRQRIGLARALYGEPPLIVLDEPNANLDDAGQAALMTAVQDLRDRGKTLFMVTHSPEAVQLADQLVVLRDGQVQYLGPPQELMAARPALATPSLGRAGWAAA